MCNIRCWVVGTWDQSRMMLQSPFRKQPKTCRQATTVLWSGYCTLGNPTFWTSRLPETPRHQDALKCEARADPNGAVQSMQTPVLGPKFCQQLFNQFALDLQLTTIRNWTCNWKSGISWYIIVYPWNSYKFIPSVEQLLAAPCGCFKVQFLTLALLHKGESAWSLDIVAGHEDFTCKNHQQPYYGI